MIQHENNHDRIVTNGVGFLLGTSNWQRGYGPTRSRRRLGGCPSKNVNVRDTWPHSRVESHIHLGGRTLKSRYPRKGMLLWKGLASALECRWVEKRL